MRMENTYPDDREKIRMGGNRKLDPAGLCSVEDWIMGDLKIEFFRELK